MLGMGMVTHVEWCDSLQFFDRRVCFVYQFSITHLRGRGTHLHFRGHSSTFAVLGVLTSSVFTICALYWSRQSRVFRRLTSLLFSNNMFVLKLFRSFRQVHINNWRYVTCLVICFCYFNHTAHLRVEPYLFSAVSSITMHPMASTEHR